MYYKYFSISANKYYDIIQNSRLLTISYTLLYTVLNVSCTLFWEVHAGQCNEWAGNKICF